MSFLLGTRQQQRSTLGSATFGFGPAHADFSASSIVPAPGDGGQHFDLSKAETSLQKVAVWACVNLTTTAAEILPVDVFSGEGKEKRRRTMPAWMADLGGDGHGLNDWIHQAIYSAMLRGNVFGSVLERDRSTAMPRVLPLLHPDDIRIDRNPDGSPAWSANGKTIDDMWHRRFNPVPGYLMGLSPIASHVLTVGTGLEVMKFGMDWFRDGAHPSSLLTSENELTEEKAKTAKSRWMGALRRRREPAVLGRGWKWQQVQMAPNESQFLETHEYTSAECCRIFGPGFAETFGYKTGGTLTYSNREERALDMLTYALDPWFVRIERILSALLPQPQYVKLNRAALLRTDLLNRFKAHNIAIASHFRAPSEIRDDEDWPPFTPAQEAEMASLAPVMPVAFDQNGAKP